MAPYDGVGGHYHWLATQKMVGLLLDTGEAELRSMCMMVGWAGLKFILRMTV